MKTNCKKKKCILFSVKQIILNQTYKNSLVWILETHMCTYDASNGREKQISRSVTLSMNKTLS